MLTFCFIVILQVSKSNYENKTKILILKRNIRQWIYDFDIKIWLKITSWCGEVSNRNLLWWVHKLFVCIKYLKLNVSW